MSTAPLITQGIGPEGSVPLLLLGGLFIGAVWSPVDPGQTPGWSVITDSQTPGWSVITDSQTPVWTEIETNT